MATVTEWAASTAYSEADLVKPTAAGMPTVDPHNTFSNADLSQGNTGWILSGDMFINTTNQWLTILGPGGTSGEAVNESWFAVEPGTPATVTCKCNYHGSGENNKMAFIFKWLDDSNNLVDRVQTALQQVNPHGGSSDPPIEVHSASEIPPDGATRLELGIHMQIDGPQTTNIEATDFTYSSAYSLASFHFLFQALNDGTSGATEPTWPVNFDDEVHDGSITWRCVYQNRLQWQAYPLMVSGATEPAWPTNSGDTVNDNTIIWTAYTKAIEDENCPQSKIVTIASSKVYACVPEQQGEANIVAFSATANPLDWSTSGDAGYLPFGMSRFGANPVAAMNLYRSNLMIFNAQGFQMWQVDENPANAALLDALPIGCTDNASLTPVGNDLVFMSSHGVRSLAMSASREAIEGRTLGSPVDEMIVPIMDTAVMAYYDSGRGQYLIAFSDNPSVGKTTVFIFTMSSKAWSRYVFPFSVDYFCQSGATLLFRSGDSIMAFDDVAGDDAGTQIDATVQWPWLDLKAPGVTKMLKGMDAVSTDAFDFEVLPDENDTASSVAIGAIGPDTRPGQIIPLQFMSASYSFRCVFVGTAWKMMALQLYYDDMRLTS